MNPVFLPHETNVHVSAMNKPSTFVWFQRSGKLPFSGRVFEHGFMRYGTFHHQVINHLKSKPSSMVVEILLLIALALASDLSGYAPRYVSCPSHALVREASGKVSSQEKEWIEARHKKTTPSLRTFLQTKTNLSEKEILLATAHDINIGLAFSGGGFRAMLTGAGAMAAMDNRTKGSYEHGLGGLLESASYVSGLSGGNWLVGSLVMNNWISVEEIVRHKELWNLQNTLLLPSGLSLDTIDFYNRIDKDVTAKKEAGFDTLITDIWARALSRRFLSELTDYGDAATWSSIRNMNAFRNQDMPFPISVADAKQANEANITISATNIEFNPFEMGSWDPTINGFVDVQYVGTPMINGTPLLKSCVIQFDNAGFVMGTLLTLFNKMVALLVTAKMNLRASLHRILMKLMNKITVKEDTILVISNNPFYQTEYHQEGYLGIVDHDKLYLVDGGEDGQNIPFTPLLQPERNVDVILAYDNSNNINAFPSGKAVLTTYARNMVGLGKQHLFPYVPDSNTFLALNYTTRPVFFGCNGSNLTSLGNHTPPLVVYTANRPYSTWSNYLTLRLSFSQQEKEAAVQNGFEVATRNNMTDDPNWSTCLGCAIIRRSQERQQIKQSEVCTRCFEDYCWKGEVVVGEYDPNYLQNAGAPPYQQKKPGHVKSFFKKLAHKILPDGISTGGA